MSNNREIIVLRCIGSIAKNHRPLKFNRGERFADEFKNTHHFHARKMSARFLATAAQQVTQPLCRSIAKNPRHTPYALISRRVSTPPSTIRNPLLIQVIH